MFDPIRVMFQRHDGADCIDEHCVYASCSMPLVNYPDGVFDPDAVDVIDWDRWASAVWDEEAQDLWTPEDVIRICADIQARHDVWGTS